MRVKRKNYACEPFRDSRARETCELRERLISHVSPNVRSKDIQLTDQVRQILLFRMALFPLAVGYRGMSLLELFETKVSELAGKEFSSKELASIPIVEPEEASFPRKDFQLASYMFRGPGSRIVVGTKIVENA